jgi:hypothetical protein
MTKSMEFRQFKVLDKATGIRAELLQDIDDWLFGQNPRIAEHYIDTGFSIRLKIRCRRSEKEFEDFCAFFSWPLRTFKSYSIHSSVTLAPIPFRREGTKKHLTNLPQEMHFDQIPMFVGITQVSQDVEEVQLGTFAISVGLSLLDTEFCGVGDSLYYSPLTGLFEFLNGIANRELMHAGWGVPVLLHEGTNQKIEARTELDHNFAENDKESVGEFWAYKANDALSRIRIHLTDEAISIFLDQDTDFRIELLDMLIGPIVLGPDTSEGMLSCYHLNMDEKKEENKQKTQKGYEIPIPSKNDFFKDLEKASESKKKPSRPVRRPKKKSKEG